VRVVLGEDLVLLRDGLIRLLTAHDFEVVEAADSGPTLLAALLNHKPDVAVVDVRMPPTFTDEGLRAAIEARAQIPGLPVLVLSQYVEQLYARELLSDRRGGVGYLLKDRVSDVAQFVDAVRRVAAGGTAMDPDVISQLLARRERDSSIGLLTPRERED
jgi:DNA-binding NarL/FixJ family response regulator